MKLRWILIISFLILARSASAAVPTFDVGLNSKVQALVLKFVGGNRSPGEVVGNLLQAVSGGKTFGDLTSGNSVTESISGGANAPFVAAALPADLTNMTLYTQEEWSRMQQYTHIRDLGDQLTPEQANDYGKLLNRGSIAVARTQAAVDMQSAPVNNLLQNYKIGQNTDGSTYLESINSPGLKLVDPNSIREYKTALVNGYTRQTTADGKDILVEAGPAEAESLKVINDPVAVAAYNEQLKTFGDIAVQTSGESLDEIVQTTAQDSTINSSGGITLGSFANALGSVFGNIFGGGKSSGGGGGISLDGLAWRISKMYLHELSRQIINWIRTGGQGGPLFVRNWQDFLLRAADQASGVFLKELNLTQLCEPFAPRLRIILGQGRQSLNERLTCTITTVLNNLQSFFYDFSNGGWARWTEITQIPQNNFYGAYLIAMDENLTRQSGAVEAAKNEALASNGYLGQEKCITEKVTFSVPATDINGEETGEMEEVSLDKPNCQVVTPGKQVQEMAAKTFGAEIDQLNLADDLDEILNVALDQMLRSMIFGTGGLFESNLSSSVSAAQDELGQLKVQIANQLGLQEAVARSQNIIALDQDSISKLNSTTASLQELKACQVSKAAGTSDADSRLAGAANTIAILKQDIQKQNLLTGKLLQDANNIDQAKSVPALRDMVFQIQNDVALLGTADAAKQKNDQASQDKSKAAQDADECKKPPASHE